MTGPALVGEIVVSKDKRLLVRVGKRGGRDLVDLRLFREGETIGCPDQPTKSGFAIPRHSVRALIELLEMVEARA